MQIEPINPTTYGGKLSLDDVEIGDILSPTFKPHVKLKRWNGLCDMALSYPTAATGLVLFDGPNNKLTYPIDNNADLEIYPKDPDPTLSEGAIEMNLVLKKKPTGNKNTFTFKLETGTIDFHKIVGLDQEFDQARCLSKWGEEHPGPFVITPTSITAEDGEVMKTRAPELVNSYRGRAKQNYRVTKELGEIKADTPNKGKQLSYTRVSRTTAHIRRGKMVDADGVEAWVEDMDLDLDGNLTFTLPAEFLKTAKYPIRQAVGVDPAYTEDWDSFGVGLTENAWTEYDVSAHFPASVVGEIILTNDDAGKEYYAGVRNTSSALDRRENLHEAEGGGATSMRMFVQVDATQKIDYYTEENTDVIFNVAGYWSNITFTEVYEYGIVADTDAWVDIDTLSGMSALTADTVYHIVCRNTFEAAITAGARTGGSSLTRSILLHEAEGGGASHADFITKTDANGDIEVYDDNGGGGNARYYNYGYFGSELDFVEKFTQYDLGVPLNDWRAVDVSADLDQDGRVTDWLLSHHYDTSELLIGARDGDDTTTNRYILEHEAEDDGGATGEVTGFGISATSNASGEVSLYIGASTAQEAFYMMGYFLPAAVGVFYQAVGGANLAIAGTLGRKTHKAVGEGSISIAGTLGRKIALAVGEGAIAIAGTLVGVKRYVQAVGGGSIAIAGTLGRTIKLAVGQGSIAIAGTLARVIKVAVGEGSIAITGALGRFIKVAVGEGAVAMTGILASVARFQQAVGGGAVTIAGALGRNIKIAVGAGSIAIAGSLNLKASLAVGGGAVTSAGTLAIKTLVAVGSGAVGIAGTLGRNIYKAVGEGAITIAGTLGRKISVAVGAGAIAITGLLNQVVKVTVGSGAVTMAGSLGRKIKVAVGSGAVAIAGLAVGVKQVVGIFYQNVGQGAVTIAGSLGRNIKVAVGEGAITSAGSLVIKTLKTVGGGAVAMAGTLAIKILVSVGEGAVTMTGVLGRKIKLAVGGGAIAIAGTLVGAKRFVQAVGGGAVAMAGSLTIKILIAVGQGSVVMSGTLGRKIFVAVGQGAVSIVGTLVGTPLRLIRLIIRVLGGWRMKLWTTAAFRMHIMTNQAHDVAVTCQPILRSNINTTAAMRVNVSVSRRGG